MPVFGQKPDTGYSPVRRRGSLWHISFASFFERNKERGPPEATGQGNKPQRREANTKNARSFTRCGGADLSVSRLWRLPAPLNGSLILPPLQGRGTAQRWRGFRCGGGEDKTRDLSLLRERLSFAARRKKAKTRRGIASEQTTLAPFTRFP